MVEGPADAIVEEYARVDSGSADDHKLVVYCCRLKARFRVAMDLKFYPFDGGILQLEVRNGYYLRLFFATGAVLS